MCPSIASNNCDTAFIFHNFTQRYMKSSGFIKHVVFEATTPFYRTSQQLKTPVSCLSLQDFHPKCRVCAT